MRSLILTGLIALGALPLSAHPRVMVRGGFRLPRPMVVVRPAPIFLEPAPVVIYRPERACGAEHYYESDRGHRHAWLHRW